MDRVVDVAVVGAGVIGLTTAVSLAESRRYRVNVLARELPGQTTSRNAGAMWGPHLVSHSQVRRWALATRDRLLRLADRPGTGVHLAEGIEASRTSMRPPEWMTQVDGFRECDPDELPAGFVVGWRYSVPMVDMPCYLDYLAGRLEKLGVAITERTVTSAAELADLAPLVVNCTGFGAGELLADQELVPVRGDLVRVANPGGAISQFFAEHTEVLDDQTYILPMGEFLLLGGTAVAGDASRVPDSAVAASILDRCAAVDERLRGARVLEHRVGIRPNRSEVRLERVEAGSTSIIHNYGHGGSGVSLAWGCAEEVRDLAEKPR